MRFYLVKSSGRPVSEVPVGQSGGASHATTTHTLYERYGEYSRNNTIETDRQIVKESVKYMEKKDCLMKASFGELEAGQTLRSSSVLSVRTRKTMRQTDSAVH